MGDLEERTNYKHQCVFCCRSFTRSEHLKRHIVGLHIKNIYLCGICGFVSKDTFELSEHMNVSHSEETPKFMCCACETHYITISELLIHEDLVHLAFDKTSCPVCTLQFKRRDHMLRHFKCQHTPHNPLHCKLCLKEFKRQDHLTRHLRTRHNKKIVKVKPKK